MYTPTLARFTSRDPLSDSDTVLLGGFPEQEVADDTQASDVKQRIAYPYRYVKNNPANLIDPSGLKYACTPNAAANQNVPTGAKTSACPTAWPTEVLRLFRTV